MDKHKGLQIIDKICSEYASCAFELAQEAKSEEERRYFRGIELAADDIYRRIVQEYKMLT